MSRVYKTEFGRLCAAHRESRRLTQRKTAEMAGLVPSTIVAIECSPTRVIGPERAIVLADEVFRLDGAERSAFLTAHEQTPIAESSDARRQLWAKRNALRSIRQTFYRMKLASVELAIRFIQESPVGEACRCDFGGGSYGDPTKPCEVCYLLETVGIFGGLGDQERTLDRLAKILTEMEAAVSPHRQPRPGTTHTIY